MKYLCLLTTKIWKATSSSSSSAVVFWNRRLTCRSVAFIALHRFSWVITGSVDGCSSMGVARGMNLIPRATSLLPWGRQWRFYGGGRGHAPPECRLNLGFQLWYTANLCRLVLTDKLEFWWFSRRRSRLKRQKAGLDPCLAVLQIKTIMPYNRCLRLSSSGFYSPAVQSRHLAKDLGIITSNLKESDHCQLLGYFATKQIRWLNAPVSYTHLTLPTILRV